MKVILVFLVMCTHAYAEKETWYWGFSLGSGGLNLVGARATELNRAESTSIGRTSIASQVHFYWPLMNGNTLFGVATGGLSRTFVQDGSSDYFGTNIISFSVLHSFGAEPGRGLFLRGGMGLGTSYSFSSTNLTTFSKDTSLGLGLRLSGGYGFRLNEETRLLVDMTYGKNIGSEGGGYFSINVGPLF